MNTIRIIHSGKGKCEDQKTVKKVIALCKKSRIDSGGAAAKVTICVIEYDDGDQGIIIKFEAPFQNKLWSKSAHSFAGRLWKMFPDAQLHLDHGQYRMDIYTHTCNPD